MDFSSYTGKRVLITGAGGFIGSHLTEKLLSLGTTVIALDHRETPFWHSLKQTDTLIKIHGEIQEALFKKIFLEFSPEFVFHLAGNANVPRSVKEPKYDFTANCTSTLEILEAVRLYAPESRIVLASSSAVYGEPGYDKIKETTPLKPISPYGTSKLCAEELCRIYHRTYNVQVLMSRLFNCYGPRMGRFVILDFIKKLMSDPSKLEILGDGRQTRDFTYIEDVLDGLLTIGLHGIPSEAYNISSGNSHSVTELATCILEILSLHQFTKIIYSGQSWKGDAQFWSVDISKAKQIGYHPQYNLRSGLRKIITWHNTTLHHAVDKSHTAPNESPYQSNAIFNIRDGIKNVVDWCKRSSW